MLQFLQALVRLRAGDTVREIARTGLMGRDKLYELAALARERGWLEADAELPDDAAIAQALKPRKRAASTVPAAEPLRESVDDLPELRRQRQGRTFSPRCGQLVDCNGPARGRREHVWGHLNSTTPDE